MVIISELWLPILLSAVFVWIVSAIIWMPLPDEDGARKALTPQNLEPGVYNIPHMETMDAVKQPESQKLFDEGPVGFLTIVPRGVPAMGGKIFQSFIFFLIVSVLVAYVVGRTLAPGTEYLTVFSPGGYNCLAGVWLGHHPLGDLVWQTLVARHQGYD